MKAIAINGSPRKGWNTDLLLQQALKGAADARAETGRCMWKDDLQPVFDKMFSADALMMVLALSHRLC